MKITRYDAGHIRATEDGAVLLGARVDGGAVRFPPPEFLIDGQQAEAVPLSAVGALYTYTTVHPGKAPAYSLAMVDFDHDLRVFGRLIDGDAAPTIGARVRAVPFQLPNGEADFAFELIGETHS